jgi:small subunit ribosomal protein S20
MANTKSAKKRMKQDARKHTANQSRKNRMKTETKKIETMIEQGDRDAVAQQLPVVFKAIDKAAKQNVIHKNTAARKKSSIARKANTVLQS